MNQKLPVCQTCKKPIKGAADHFPNGVVTHQGNCADDYEECSVSAKKDYA